MSEIARLKQWGPCWRCGARWFGCKVESTCSCGACNEPAEHAESECCGDHQPEAKP